MLQFLSLCLCFAWCHTMSVTQEASSQMVAMEVNWHGNPQMAVMRQENVASTQLFKLDGDEPFNLTSNQTTELIGKCMGAVAEVLPDFLVQPTNITGGVLRLTSGLFAAFDSVIQETDFKNNTDYAKFKEAFYEGFENASHTADFESVVKKIEAGEMEEIGKLIALLARTAKPFVVTYTDGLPEKWTQLISDLFDTVIEVGDGLTDCWHLFEKGEMVEGAQEMYKVLRSVSKKFIPPEIQNNTIFRNIMHGVDHIMSNLTTHVRKFEERLVNNSICYKGTQKIMRPYEAPTTCDPGYTERNGHCFKYYQCDCIDEISEIDVRNCGGLYTGASRLACVHSKTEEECGKHKFQGYPMCKWDKQSASLTETQQSSRASSLLSSQSFDSSLKDKSRRRRAPPPPPPPPPTPNPTKRPESAPVATCADKTREKKCYLDCPSEYIAEGTDTCKPQCPTGFPVEGKIGLISSPGCGVNGEVLNSALAKQIGRLTDTVIQGLTFTFKALEDGDKIEQSDVQNLLDSGLALVREFIYPDCKYQTV